MSNIAITTDSPSDLPASVKQRYDVGVAPLHVLLDGTDYFDGEGITINDIYAAYDEKKILPKTSAIPVAEYVDFFRKYTDKGMAVVHISFSSGISATYQNAVIAASEIDGEIHIIDSLALSLSISLLVCKAGEMREKGLGAEEITNELEKMVPKLSTSFIISSLEFLYKGGRCSALSAFGANILGIKPCIEMTDGKMEISKKYRGSTQQVLLKYLDDRLSDGEYDRSYAFIAHTGLPAETLEAMKKTVRKSGAFDEIIISPCGTVVTSHGGKGTSGIFLLRK